jgi:thioredoxin-related protein
MTACRRFPLLLALVLLAAAAGSPARAEEDNRSVDWLTYREALERGAARDRPILLHFTASYSSLCRKMKRETYSDRRVIRYLNENFAVAMVDIERLPSLARKFDVEALPTVWFLDAAGKPLTSVAGEVGPEKMLRIAEYVREKIYEHTDYQTWLDKRHGR